ncbi:hypothetical protein SAMN05421736_101206 [Evansella caseinilytica]|uniref:Uncharacterized protein n=1 Tax=Evansella caseinilytica TaxID=1503961 RepID=A0A1H3GLP2_9BACI|nr:hypothetical protein [Evansella caseinilytica]SDY03990.1 hypothetical protein SAMN05421736_101206 [Evansella caseinilytica]
MRLPKWGLLLFYVAGFLSFGYLSYLEFSANGRFGYLMGGCSLLFGIQAVRYIFTNKGGAGTAKRSLLISM